MIHAFGFMIADVNVFCFSSSPVISIIDNYGSLFSSHLQITQTDLLCITICYWCIHIFGFICVGLRARHRFWFYFSCHLSIHFEIVSLIALIKSLDDICWIDNNSNTLAHIHTQNLFKLKTKREEKDMNCFDYSRITESCFTLSVNHK